MNKKVSILFGIGLLACSTQALTAPPVDAPATTPPPIVIRPYSKPSAQALIPKDSKGLPPPRICNLGSDCLTMDSRPFEMCQVSGKSCGDKLAELLLVERPKIVIDPVPLRITR